VAFSSRESTHIAGDIIHTLRLAVSENMGCGANLLLCVVAGAACHAAEPGFFRMCWAWPHPGSIPTAVGRIAAAVKQFRQAQRNLRQQQATVNQALVNQMQKVQLQ
jgi:hypothetical protein